METKSEEPPAKKAKTEEVEELEADAPKETATKLKDTIKFLPRDCTLNVADSTHGNMLTCLSDGGLTYLLAGARANVGMKSGRYMFEVNVIEHIHHKTEANSSGRMPQPRNVFRIGLSLEGSSLLMGDDEQSICFDSDGSYMHNKKKTTVGAKVDRQTWFCLLVNLDSTSPNANTVSLFRNGERASKPQVLPECLQGKVLFPTVTFRNALVSYSFGPLPKSPLPFACRMLQDASAKDVEVAPDNGPKDGKFTAMFPIGVPDEGCFQWLDSWLVEHPDYVEISDRKLLDWAQKSGVGRQTPYSVRTCTDKPQLNFGLPLLDDRSVQKALLSLASLQKRNLVVMEMKSMLVKPERDMLTSVFRWFKRVAIVVAGEPPAAFQKQARERMLKEKQEASDAEFKKKREEEKNKIMAAKKAEVEAKKKLLALEEAKKKGEEKKKKLEEIVRKKKEELLRKKAEKEGKEVPKEEDVKEEEKVEEEMKEEEVKEEAKQEDEEEEEMDVDVDPEPPVVELTPAESKIWVVPSPQPDLAPDVLSKHFEDFSFPSNADGFEELKYEWQNAAKAAEHLKTWQQNKKLTARIENLQIGDWFTKRLDEWLKFLKLCKDKHNEYKAQVVKTLMERKSGTDDGEAKEPAVDLDSVDVFGVEDIFNIGGTPAQPVFSQFQFEDWAMTSIRFELYLLIHAFKKDVKDQERKEIHEDNIAYYYEKYYNKKLNPLFFGRKSVKEVVGLITDTVAINKRSVLTSLLPSDLETMNVFFLLTEEARRERLRRVDMGDEDAKLKVLSATAMAGNLVAGIAAANALKNKPP